MRVLSFVPALLLAVASFVAAAPASTPADTSCVSPPPGGNGNDAALHPVIAIIANATSHIQPLSAQLTSLKGDSCTPDAVSGIVVQINAVVSTCSAQLEAAAKVDLTGLDLTNLCSTIFLQLSLILTVLDALVAVVLTLGTGAVGTVQTVICNLLNAVTRLVGCLDVFVVASVSGVLGPVIILVDNALALILSIVIKLNVFLGVN